MKSGWGVKILKIILILLGAVLLIAAGLLLWIYINYGELISQAKTKAQQLAVQSSEESFREEQTSLIYAANGELITSMKGIKEVYYLEYEYIPQYVIDAMLITEDRKFYDHEGYDIYAIIRAIRALIINKGEIHQGGSTITQQLARAVFLSNEVTLERKITEVFLASELEKKYTKKQILEFYLNNIYFANGYYGIQAAAYGYFGESVRSLSLSQIAFLCAIPNNPSLYNPITDFENTIARRDGILLQMVEEGGISDSEYSEAVQEEIILNMHKISKNDYIETFTYHCAVRALMERDGFVFRNYFLSEADKAEYEREYYELYYQKQHSLYTGGYRIYTSIDLEMQKQLAKCIDDRTAEYTEVNSEGIYALQAAAVCIDNESGRVAAIVGGRSQDYDGYTLNRAYQSPRQPGSSIKPLIVYTPVLERGYTAETTVIDERFEGGPRNSSGVYSGEITLEYAVVNSKNTVAWRLLEELTPKVGLSYLYKMNFSHLDEKDNVPAAALGGLTYGATTLEMTSAYAALANDGVYREPTCIMKIMASDGRELVGDTVDETRIYKEEAANEMTDMLAKVLISGTGKNINTENFRAAGKTGTTNNQKDGWFVGFSAYYTTGVWVGYDMPRQLDELMGNTYPAYIWSDYMNIIHQGLKKKNP